MEMSLTGDLVASTPAGGIVFTGCAMQSTAATGGSQPHAQPHAHARRREVVVNGKRVKTVDVHAHCAVPAAMALIKHPLEAPGLLMADTSTRLAAMDAQGIEVEALSINPGPLFPSAMWQPS
jgi:aminocarboxymuconate-semialdehyde decarboxylase